MKLWTPILAVTVAVAVPALAQDSTTKTRTKIKADDARIVSMTGCLRQDTLSNTYSLVGTMTARAGDELKTNTKVKTDVDKDGTKVKTTTTTDGDHAVATSGSMRTFAILPGDVALSRFVGQRVQLSAIMVEPGHGDADVTIKEKTNVDPEHGDDSTERTKTKIELPKAPYGQYTVVSASPMSGTCSTY